MDLALLELLICPLTQGKMEYDKERQALISRGAKLVYPVRDGIPILLESQAIPLEDWLNQPEPDETKVAQISEVQLTPK